MERSALICLCIGFACADSGDRGASEGDAGIGSATASGSSSASADGSSGGDGDSGGSSADDGDDSGGSDSGADDGGVRFDVEGEDEGGNTAGDEGGEDEACCDDPSPRHFVWIANSPEGTVSKIDTVTALEEGRYVTRPDGAGDPSRTSVNLTGRAVAVANRNGGITKIWANVEDCVDQNGNGTVETSTGATALPWGEDECVAWDTPLNYASNRPVAWTCIDDQEMVWTAGTLATTLDADVLLLDGATGDVVETVTIAGYGGSMAYGPYGGAVDSVGNFWTTPMGLFTQGNPAEHRLHKVDALTFDVTEAVTAPSLAPYGITVDDNDDVWVTSLIASPHGVGRYQTATGQWDLVMEGSCESGIAQGPDGRMWAATQAGSVFSIDRMTLQSTPLVSTGGGSGIKGVALDPQGALWVVDYSTAYRIDPATAMIDAMYAGLTSPYTYSDMTGWAVQNAMDCEPPPAG